jgi:hypothetical protein
VAVFGSAEELYGIVTPFLEEIVSDPEIGPKFVAGNTSFRVTYSDPEAVFFLDATQNPPIVKSGKDAEAADAEVSLLMSADDGHKFWLGKLNIPVSLARRKVKVDGSVTKLLGLLPALQPAYGRYRAHLEATGHAALI